MSLRDALLVMVGGLVAGTANTIAGGGSLLTFPLLVALGLPPLDANVTNTVGIAPAGLGGAIGYRRELVGQRGRMLVLLPFTVVGAAAGAALLLTTPARPFDRVAPCSSWWHAWCCSRNGHLLAWSTSSGALARRCSGRASL